MHHYRNVTQACKVCLNLGDLTRKPCLNVQGLGWKWRPDTLTIRRIRDRDIKEKDEQFYVRNNNQHLEIRANWSIFTIGT